ncbi:hypothetical protein SARI_03778 [Salmonella enterica subsp. arizonae serovar 62:z4,z23:-]|uniref:Uncharacterized protein n=1 Tax=Salmonella arizonae (strain ATCC BAA-731 / CDC346-86 / RSK2980) TaxID=41514 RepID=A9MJR1_SALAR|nr:hypothetical protein SARI_03778 [Salmonella enterica subsp. arizonae serovar 62:z4,z23:-]
MLHLTRNLRFRFNITTLLLLLKQRVINFVNISLLKIESKNHFCLLNFYYKCQWGVFGV